MVFNKTLIVLLLAILGTSWIPDGRSNGLASACWSRTTRPDRCEEKKNPTGATTEIPKEVTTKVPTIDDIPQEDEEFAPLTVGIWVEKILSVTQRTLLQSLRELRFACAKWGARDERLKLSVGKVDEQIASAKSTVGKNALLKL
nr:BV-like protein [Cotesia vestalis bracovirus]